MNLLQVWHIVWNNEPLQWVILSVFLMASFFESLFTWEYVKKELKDTNDAIKYLSNPKNTRNPLQNTSNLKLIRWLKDHRIRRDEKNQQYTLSNYPSILIRSAPSSYLRFIPTICTALGLLGTFYGIQKGLSGINPGLSESQDLINASKDLFAGMRTAFSNSLLGLGSASLFTFVIFICDSIRQKQRKSLLSKLKQIATLDNSFQDNDLAIQLKNATENISKLSSENIGIEVGNALTPIFKDIRNELVVLREIKQDQGQEVLQNLILNLREQVIEPIVDRLGESANLTRDVSVSVQNLNNELAGVSKSLAGSIETIGDFQLKTVDDLKKFADSLQQTLGQFQNETKDVLGQVAGEINRGVDQSIQGMEYQRNAFRDSADQAAATFRGIREDLQSALTTQAEQQRAMLEEVTSQTKDILNQANTTFQKQSETIKSVGEESSKVMENAQQNLNKSLLNIDAMLRKTSDMVQEELQQFRLNYQESLEQFFQQQNNLLEGTLGQQREGLAEVVANLEQVFNAEAERRNLMNQSMDKIQETVEVINRLASAVGLTSQQQKLEMKEFIRDLAQEIQQVQQRYNDHTNKIDESLNNWSNNLITTQTKFFDDADFAMAKISGGLLEAANILVAAKNNNDLQN